jgi:hypothetical protein
MRLTRLAIATAPALFVLLWSTGFIGARYGMPYVEPLTFLAVGMGFAVGIMAAIALAGGAMVHGLGLRGRVHRDQSRGTGRHFRVDRPAATDRDFDTRQPLHGREGHAAAMDRACAGAGRGFACSARPQQFCWRAPSLAGLQTSCR